MDVWSAQSRYRATIQDALDYTITQPTQGESILSLLPHIASVAVAYGDPHGKYEAYIQKQDSGYARRTWWWHDVNNAFGPASTMPHQRKRWARSRSTLSARALPQSFSSTFLPIVASETNDTATTDAPPTTGTVTDPAWAPGEEPIRPDIFGDVEDNTPVQLDDAVFVTWDDIRPYYLTVMPSISPLDDDTISNSTSTSPDSSERR